MLIGLWGRLIGLYLHQTKDKGMWIQETFGVPLNIIILCIMAGAARVLIASEALTIRGVLGIMTAALLLALIAYPYLTESGEHKKGLVTLLVAVGSLFAKDVGLFLIRLLDQAREDPLAIVRDLLNFWHTRKRKRDDE